MSHSNTKTASSSQSLGFTIVEMLIIAPIVILAIGGILALMIALVSDVISTREHTAMAYDVQSGLDRIEQDVRLSIAIKSTTDALPSGYGSGNASGDTSAFNSNNAIILTLRATTKNPTDNARELVFMNKPNDCGSANKVLNPSLTYSVIYYRKDESLYRRVVLSEPPAGMSVCPSTTIWQRNTCSYLSCTVKDEKVLDNIDNITLTYFNGNDMITPYSTADTLTTTSVRVSVNSAKSVAGKSVTATGSMRVTRINN